MTDSKSVGLITRAGSTPATGTTKDHPAGAVLCGFEDGSHRDRRRRRAGARTPSARKCPWGIRPPPPRRRGLRIVRDDVFILQKRRRSLTTSVLLSKSDPLRWAPILFFGRMQNFLTDRTTSSRTTYRSRRRFHFAKNADAYSLRRSSFQNRTRFAGLRFCFLGGYTLRW